MAICTIPLSPSGELPKYTIRVLGENELLRGASIPGAYTVLLPSSLLREAVPVLYASLADPSHLCALPNWTVARRCGVSKTNQTRPARPVFNQNKHYENSLVNPTCAGCDASFRPELSNLLLVTSVRFPLFL